MKNCYCWKWRLFIYLNDYLESSILLDASLPWGWVRLLHLSSKTQKSTRPIYVYKSAQKFMKIILEIKFECYLDVSKCVYTSLGHIIQTNSINQQNKLVLSLRTWNLTRSQQYFQYTYTLYKNFPRSLLSLSTAGLVLTL